MSDEFVIEEVVSNDNKGCRDFQVSHVPIKSMTTPHLYIQNSVIGNGAYGTVFLARNVASGTAVAMKRIVLPDSDGIPMSTLREITMLKKIDRFDHPNIIKLLDVCHSYNEDNGNSELYLIYVHVEQDLSTYLNKVAHGMLPCVTIQSITHQMICGIQFLHSNGVLHRDIKPQNILITNNEIIKLADFGLSKSYNQDARLTSVVVTLWYRSPEILLNLKYSSPVDIWSIGCIMAEMYKLEPLFMGTSEGDQLDKIFRVNGSPLASEWTSEVISYSQFAGRKPVPYTTLIPRLSDTASDILVKMLEFTPSKRITAKEALNHPYFSDSIYQIPLLNR